MFFVSVIASLSYGQAYSSMTDSVFNYLQGDWYQSYRVHNGSACANGIQKFPVVPLKITYEQTSDTTRIIVKHSDEKFYSHALNWGFESGKRKDTLFQAWDDVINEYLTINNGVFNPFIQINSNREHLMVFYEYSWVAFERTPHRAMATHLVKNDWEGGYCTIKNGQRQCLTMITFANFLLKNDTLIYRTSGDKKFLYNYKEQVYQEIGKDSVKLIFNPKDSSVTITDSVSFVSSYRKSPTARMNTYDKYRKYLGDWTDFTYGGIVGIDLQNDTIVGMNGNQVAFKAILLENIRGIDYLQVLDQENGCVPAYSRYEYIGVAIGSPILRNYTTGEEFHLLITDVKDAAHGGSKSLLFTNPITTGKLVMDSLQEFAYEIFDLRGVSIMKGKTNDGQVDVESLNNGYHFIKVSQNNSVEILKFVKE